MAAQTEAIRDGAPRITAAIVQEVYKTGFRAVDAALKAHEKGGRYVAELYPDIYMPPFPADRSANDGGNSAATKAQAKAQPATTADVPSPGAVAGPANRGPADQAQPASTGPIKADRSTRPKQAAAASQKATATIPLKTPIDSEKLALIRQGMKDPDAIRGLAASNGFVDPKAAEAIEQA